MSRLGAERGAGPEAGPSAQLEGRRAVQAELRGAGGEGVDQRHGPGAPDHAKDRGVRGAGPRGRGGRETRPGEARREGAHCGEAVSLRSILPRAQGVCHTL